MLQSLMLHLLLEIVRPTRRSVVVAILSQVLLWKTEVDALHRENTKMQDFVSSQDLNETLGWSFFIAFGATQF